MAIGALAEQVVEAQVSSQPKPTPSAPAKAGSARMKAGTQHGDSDAILRVLARLRRQPHLQPAAVADSSTRRGRSSR